MIIVDIWQETEQRFQSVTDRLGNSIDEGIFETVVGLNILGITTTLSCEGHLDWGVPYPWVNFEANQDQRYLLYQYLTRF